MMHVTMDDPTDEKVQDNNVERHDHIPKVANNISLTLIQLPNPWVLYLYDKQTFKKMASRPTFQAKPYREICTMNTVNDLMFIMQLMEAPAESTMKIDTVSNLKINLDMNDYIIMRKGIEPIWEDPKNSKGGTFTVKMAHSKGYDVWSTFVMYMVGEIFTEDMQYINGITVSYICDTNSFHNPVSHSINDFTYVKIWDGKSDRTRDQFVNIIPDDLLDKIKNESLMYSIHNTKPAFGDGSIIDRLNGAYHNNSRHERGGFSNRGNGSGRNNGFRHKK